MSSPKSTKSTAVDVRDRGLKEVSVIGGKWDVDRGHAIRLDVSAVGAFSPGRSAILHNPCPSR